MNRRSDATTQPSLSSPARCPARPLTDIPLLHADVGRVMTALRRIGRLHHIPDSQITAWEDGVRDFFALRTLLRTSALWGAGVFTTGQGWRAVRGVITKDGFMPDVFGTSVTLSLISDVTSDGPTVMIQDVWP